MVLRGGEWGERRMLGRNKGRSEVSVLFMQAKHLNKVLRVEVEFHTSRVQGGAA